MKIPPFIVQIASKNSNCDFIEDFDKVMNEFNFEDNLKGDVHYSRNQCLQVKFDNDWVLEILAEQKYNMYNKNNKISYCNYDQLLEFMDKNDIRKPEQCAYENAELYILEINT